MYLSLATPSSPPTSHLASNATALDAASKVTAALASTRKLVGLLAFAPQLVLCAVLGWVFRRDTHVACFLQTFAFVTFNKVCTSQVSPMPWR